MPAWFVFGPEEAIYLLWIVWAATWFLPILFTWSSTIKRVPLGREGLYRAITFLGWGGVFAIYNRPAHGQFLLWATPEAIGWVLVAVVIAFFAFAWWARLHLGRLWSARITQKADHHVVDTGPYAIVRHPIYTAILGGTAAFALEKGNWPALLGAALMVVGYYYKARLEERFLSEQLGPAEYAAYRTRVPMLLPFGPKG